MDSDQKDVGGVVASSEKLQLPKKNSYGDNYVKIDGNSNHALANENVDTKVSLVVNKSSLTEKLASDADIVLDKMTTSGVEQENVVRDKIKSQVDLVKYGDKMGDVLVDQVEVEEKVKSSKDSGLLDDSSSRKAKINSSTKLSEDKNNSGLQKSNIDSSMKEKRASVSTVTTTKEKIKLDGVNSHSLEKEISKKLKSDGKTKLSNGYLAKESARQSPEIDTRIEGQVMEVTRRPNAVSYHL